MLFYTTISLELCRRFKNLLRSLSYRSLVLYILSYKCPNNNGSTYACFLMGFISLDIQNNGKIHWQDNGDHIEGSYSLDVVPLSVENMDLYIPSESSEASSVLKSMGTPYPWIRESAHTQFLLIDRKQSQKKGQYETLVMVPMWSSSCNLSGSMSL